MRIAANPPEFTASQEEFVQRVSRHPAWDDIQRVHSLVGGTALAAFYYDHRLSDDLDFFFRPDIDDIGNFPAEAIRMAVTETFVGATYRLAEVVRHQFVIQELGKLKVEFVRNPIIQVRKPADFQCGNTSLCVAGKSDIFLQKLAYFATEPGAKSAIDLSRMMADPELASLVISPLRACEAADDLFGHRGLLWSEPGNFLAEKPFSDEDFDSVMVKDPELTKDFVLSSLRAFGTTLTNEIKANDNARVRALRNTIGK